MGRPKNIENKNFIARTAYNLFMQEGYGKTTYKKIAEASGKEQTLIQYYFPKKNILIVEYLNKILELSREYIEKNLNSGNALINLYLIGQSYFSFLLMNEKSRNLTLEIVSSRDITDEIIRSDENWSFQFLNINSASKKEISDAVVLAMGGAYELVFRYLNTNNPIDIAWIMKKSMLILTASLNQKEFISEEYFDPYILDAETLSQIDLYILNLL